ncbi:MAG TPA: hypothetical protein VFG43_04715 [Geminicoccaceae bacterium]|nr:hypothetical protein [Geminicoccaceae bacterium]
MAESEVERRKHEAGGPGKASRKDDPDPEKRSNKPGQKQTPKERGQGKGGLRGVPEEKRRPAG